MPSIISNALSEKNLTVYGDGKAIHSFVYINDVVKSIVNSLELNGSHLINIAGNEQVTIGKLAAKIVNLANKSGIKVELDHVESTIPNKNYIFDNSELRSLLLCKLTSLDDGLEREFNYIKELKQNGRF
jgi:UDP-glucose 4-epimerase